MVKDSKITVLVETKFRNDLATKSAETGVAISEVVRRALEVWLITGELPKVSTIAAQPATPKKGGKRSAAKKA